MKRHAFLLIAVFGLLLHTGCSQDHATAPVKSDSQSGAIAFDPELVANEIATRAGWLRPDDAGGAMSASAEGLIADFQREVIAGDIVHYSADVRVGSGTYDVIRVHRVVRESHPNRPVKSQRSVFLLHGDLIGFEGVYLFGARSASTPDDYSAAVYLASNGVDVWGMDQNWILVPGGLADHSFMSDWGIPDQADNLGAGLAVARYARLATGNGFNRMLMGGYSSGVWTGYAYLNGETQLPPGQRHVRGFIALDGNFKTDNETDRLGWCELASYYQSLHDGGVYADDLSFFPWMGDLARTDPDGPSPVFPGFTNLQAAWGMGTYPSPPPDWYHFLAGQFDGSGMPAGLTVTRTDAWLDFMLNGVAVEPTQFIRDYSATVCGDTPWDDHLGEIDVPVLLIAPAGGMGQSNYHTLTLLGSSDVTIVEGRLTPPVDLSLEFGHIDLWTADIAPHVARDMMWAPMLDWILDHSAQGPPVDVVRGKN
jgi:hypothetical protein